MSLSESQVKAIEALKLSDGEMSYEKEKFGFTAPAHQGKAIRISTINALIRSRWGQSPP